MDANSHSDAEPPLLKTAGSSRQYGPGAVGVTYWALIAVAASCTPAVATATSDATRLWIIFGLFVFVALVMAGCLFFAHKHPEAGLMRSNDFLTWSMSARNLKIIDSTPPRENRNPPAEIAASANAAQIGHGGGE